MTPDLHDTVLTEVRIGWTNHEATLSFRRADGSVGATIHGCSRVVLPRDEPWGPSSSVYAVKAGRSERGGVRLELEMQSGDVLVVEGASLEWAQWD